MAIHFNNSSYSCDYAEVGVNEKGQVLVTFFRNTPSPTPVTKEVAKCISEDPLFATMLRAAYDEAIPERPLWYAFERLLTQGGEVRLRFEYADAGLEDAA